MEIRVMVNYIKKISCILAAVFMIFTISTVSGSFAMGSYEKRPKTEEAKESDVKGVFTVILYGGKYSEDINTVVILDNEGDGYSFKPYARDYAFEIKESVPAEEALAEANRFLSAHRSYMRTRVSRIMDSDGSTIGYELRPLYHTFSYGFSDVLNVYYGFKNSDVVVSVSLRRSVEKRLFDGDGPMIFNK